MNLANTLERVEIRPGTGPDARRSSAVGTNSNLDWPAHDPDQIVEYLIEAIPASTATQLRPMGIRAYGGSGNVTACVNTFGGLSDRVLLHHSLGAGVYSFLPPQHFVWSTEHHAKLGAWANVILGQATTENDDRDLSLLVGLPAARHLLDAFDEVRAWAPGSLFAPIIGFKGDTSSAENVAGDWAYSENDVLEPLSELVDGWAGPDTFAPSEAVLADLKSFFGHFPSRRTAPAIAVDDDGSVTLRFALPGDRWLAVDFNGQQRLLATFLSPDHSRNVAKSIAVDEPGSFREFLDSIQVFDVP